MIAVFSFCASDREQAVHLAQHIEALRGVERHDCLLLHPTDTNARGIMEPLKASFQTLEVMDYAPLFTGWPQGPNQCFQVACGAMLKRDERDGWLWLEADCVPTTPRWLDVLQSEYRYAGRPVMGVLNDSVDTRGTITGQHVTGVAIYPNDFVKLCPTVKDLSRVTECYLRAHERVPAFDCYIAPYAVKNCVQTKLIQHAWKSFDFLEHEFSQFGRIPDRSRIDEGRMFNSTFSLSCRFQQSYSGCRVPDIGEAVLVHGSKDTSLLDIIQKRLIQSGKTQTISV